MSDSTAPRPRRCLVLGAGGVLGAAWTVGALHALRQVDGWDPRDADVLMGTSAGAVLAAALAGGVGTETLVNHQRGVVDAADPSIEYDYDSGSGGARPPRPRLRLGSPALLRYSLPRVRRHPVRALYALLPEGRGSLAPIGRLVEAIQPDGAWPLGRALRIVTMDYDAGHRVVFDGDQSPSASVSDAVMASCTVPGWYAPMRIGERRYVDGGVYSPSSLDLLIGEDFDEITVLAPMVAFRYDRPRSPLLLAERGWRRMVTGRVATEADQLRGAGATLRLLAPGPEDLAAIGANLMDPVRRTNVLETSLRTSAEVLREAAPGQLDRVTR